MKKLLFLFLLTFTLLLSACATPEEEELHFLEVELTVSPDQAKLNEPVKFQAKLTYGDEVVTDANEVKFEIWRAKDEEHETIVIEKAENGVYELEKTFDREGTYYVISHVTARSMHNMPKKEFVIGAPSDPEDESSSKSKDMNMDTDESNDEHGH